MPLHLDCVEIMEPMPAGDAEDSPAAPARPAVPPPAPRPTPTPFWSQPAWVAPVAFLAGFLTATLAVGLYAVAVR
jgi:hypothetical protein